MGALAEAFALAACVSAVAVWLLWSKGRGLLPQDQPNERSLHDAARPRSGGLGLWAGVFVSFAVFGAGIERADPLIAVLLLLATPVIVVSFVDDVAGVPRRWRFLVHGLAGAAATAFIAPDWLVLWPLVVVGLIWWTNLYNFMDGADGYAGGMTVIGFGAYAIAGLLSGEVGLALGSAVIAGAAFGFLAWNLPPSRIFMGDAGSTGLGFLAGSIGMAGWARDAWPLWFPVLVFGVFAVDATATLIWRMVRRERFWEAHRSHLYQVFVLAGHSHQELLRRSYPLMILTASSAIAFRTSEDQLIGALIMSWGVVFGILWLRLRNEV